MREQPDGRSRRKFLLAAGAAGLTTVAGCVGGGKRGKNRMTTPTGTGTGVSQSTTDAEQPTNGSGDQSMSIAILSAGSLNNALLSDFKAAVDVPVRIESHGSSVVARLINEGVRDPDIVALADTALFNKPLTPKWHSVFTSNAIVIAINDTKLGKRIANAGEGWYKPLIDGDVKIGRTPPDQDPLGYRTLFMLDLASRYYKDAKDLREKILKKGQIYSETGLLGRFETGALDVAVVYRNMATERGYEYIDLPDKIDLSNPKYVEEWYSTTDYTLSNGKKIQGDLIAYGATIRHMSDAALKAFDVLTTGNYLTKHGFILRKQFPSYSGDVPKKVKQAVSTSDSQNARAPTLSSEVSGITLLV